MKTPAIRFLAILGLLLVVMPGAQAQTAARMTEAANAFLATLDAAQRKNTVFAFDDAQQRARWSNLPLQMVPRSGVSFESMNEGQRKAAMALLAAALSRTGLQKVQAIMEGDEVLKQRGGGGPRFGQDLYFFSFLGTPSATTPWMLQFSGHHLALNITVAGARGVLTPTLTAAQPALFTRNDRTVRPLGGESDKAATLFNTLDAVQRKQAVLGSRVADLVLGPGQDGRTIQPEGLKASAMNEKQRALLLEVVAEWAGIINDEGTAQRMAEIRAGMADTWFAWSGPSTATPGTNIESYYRIQGPQLVIEYAPQRGDPALHVHTMYRDPTNDYGRRLTGR
jgi:hypothetical protein